MSRARSLSSEPVVTILSRSEMAFSGVPEKEMPFLRNHARAAFPPTFWELNDPLRRQRTLFDLLEEYTRFVRKGSPQRADALEEGVKYAREQWERSARRLQAQQVRRLPKLPNPRDTGAVPEEDPIPSPREARASRDTREREMVKRAHANEKATDGHEKWNPEWGNPDEEMPAVLPLGMQRLPQSEDVQVPAKQQKPGSPHKAKSKPSSRARG